MRHAFRSLVFTCTSLVVIAGGCTSSDGAKASKSDAAPAPLPAPEQPVAAQSTPAVAESGTAQPSLRGPAIINPSWWNRPARVIPGNETLITQADANDAAGAKKAAIDDARAKLKALGADVERLEVLESTVTKVRFDGQFRAFVMATAPKAKEEAK